MGEMFDGHVEILDGTVGENHQIAPSIAAAAGSSNDPRDNSITENLDNAGGEIGKDEMKSPKKAFESFLELWTLAAKAIAENKVHSTILKDKVKEIEIHLTYIRRSLGSDDKWGKCVMGKCEFLQQMVDSLIKHLQSTPSSGTPDSSNQLHDNPITKILDEIGNEIGKTKTESLQFIRLPEEAFFCFFKRWSEVKAIAGSEDSTLKKRVNKIDNDLTDIQRSLGSVDKWEISAMDMFEFLDQKVGQLQQHLQDTPSAAGSSNEHPDNPSNEKLNDFGREISKIKMNSQPLIRLPAIPPAAEKITDPITKWVKLESEDEIMDSPAMADALSTYDNLEPRLKLCFLSLSMFPEGKNIRKRSLIYWWIGEDFLGNKDVEQVGEDCFKKLCESGLIEPISDDQSRSPHSCRLHHWIRWMAIRIAKETMFLDFDSDGKPSSVHSECPRRACVAETGERRAEKVELGEDHPEIRSLFNIDVHCLECGEEEFKKLNNIIALQLGRWNDAPKYHIEIVNPTFLNHLGLLKRLRYLGLQGISRIAELPDSIKELSELRVLDLRACHNLEKLPAGIAMLKKLTHLDVSECYLLEYMPKGLGSLSDLQFLDGFVISNFKNACKLSELTKLEKLQKLSISISLSMEGMTARGELNELEKIQCLQTLTITWGGGEASPSEAPKKRSLKRKLTRSPRLTSSLLSEASLSLPPNLTKLDLRCFPNQEGPKLRNGERLKKLYFRGGKLRNLGGIQEGDKASQVETVRLRFLQDFNIERPKLEEMFPHLKYADIFKCPHITSSSFNVEARDEFRLDEASTSNGKAIPVYRINGVRYPRSIEFVSKI